MFCKDAGVITDGDAQDTLDTAVGKVRTKCGSHVNLSMAMFKLMHAKQGSKTITEFSNEVEELAIQCQFDSHPYNKERAMRDTIIFGTADEQLRREVLAKAFNLQPSLSLQQISTAAVGYEQSRKNAGTIKKNSAKIQRNVDACSQRSKWKILWPRCRQGNSAAKNRSKERRANLRLMQISALTAHHTTDLMHPRSVRRRAKHVWRARRKIILRDQRHARALERSAT